jgi:hypothetical protein
MMLNLEPVKARLAEAAHIWLWWWDEASQRYAISTDAGNSVAAWAERREDAAAICKDQKIFTALIEEVERLRELLEHRKAQMLPFLEQIESLKRQHEVDQAQLRGYEKALEWYANPANWVEQVDDRGRETLRFRWADDDGHMARRALSVWRESKRA